MAFNPAIHHRHSIRLPGYDYTQPGAYFITICVVDRYCLFGEIINGKTKLNTYGNIVFEKWEWLAVQYPYIKLDGFIVMPNHFHGILWIRNDSGRGGSRTAPTKNPEKIKPVGRLIGAFKTVSTKEINIRRNTPGACVWQRDFYDHIGRDEKDVFYIRRHIRENPLHWVSDEKYQNPQN
jgi:putative transposase